MTIDSPGSPHRRRGPPPCRSCRRAGARACAGAGGGTAAAPSPRRGCPLSVLLGVWGMIGLVWIGLMGARVVIFGGDWVDWVGWMLRAGCMHSHAGWLENNNNNDSIPSHTHTHAPPQKKTQTWGLRRHLHYPPRGRRRRLFLLLFLLHRICCCPCCSCGPVVGGCGGLLAVVVLAARLFRQNDGWWRVWFCVRMGIYNLVNQSTNNSVNQPTSLPPPPPPTCCSCIDKARARASSSSSSPA